MKTETGRGSTTHPRVLFFSHETTLSGAPMQLLHLITDLNRQGWDAVFAAPEPGPIADLLRKTGTRVEIDSSFLVDPDRANLRALSREFDLVVANTITSWPVVEAAHQEKVPAIWYIHETLAAARFIEQIPQARAALNRARLIVVPAQQAARVLKGLTRTRIETVPSGIPDVPDFKSKENGKTISFVALDSFEADNGQDFLVEAIRSLDPKTRKNSIFKIAGPILDRQFFAKVRKDASRLMNVELIGSPGHEEAVRLLANADAVISSSRGGTMSLAILEATSLSKAIICIDVGGIGEWIRDGLNGLLLPTGNATALADAIARLAQDRQLRARLGAAARRTFERRFCLEKFVSRFAELLEQLPQEKQFLPQPLTYERWIENYDALTPGGRIGMQRCLRALNRQPLISIVLPVFNPDPDVLTAAVDSVRKQIYDNWELCIADDASSAPHVRPFLERLAAADARVKLIFRERNGHISACSNSALGLATGEWCALLDHDDVLAENALAFVALEIARHPAAGLIYSDQDSVDRAGVRSNPFFKTDWDPMLFLGQNFVNHLGVYKTSLLREIGGFREGYEGSQDYDLVLRCVERLRPDQIRHIPHVLYYWRMIPGSVGASGDAKTYAREAARRAIADHLVRAGIAGRVEPCPENGNDNRVIFEVPKPEPLVSILMPTRDKVDVLRRCIMTLLQRTDYSQMELIVIDNDSTERETLDFLRELTEQRRAHVFRHTGKFNFSRLNNFAAAHARGEVIAFLNNDLEIINAGWLREMVSLALQPQVGAVGARLWSPEGTLQHGGVILGFGGVAGHAYYHLPRGHPGYWNRAFLQHNCSAVTAACMVMRKEVFDATGGFNETELSVNFNDVDLCLRLRQRGLQIIWTPHAELIHHESSTRGRLPTPEKIAQLLHEAAYMQKKWGAELLSDPFYSPNFSLNWPGFDFAFPPRWQSCAGTVSIAA